MSFVNLIYLYLFEQDMNIYLSIEYFDVKKVLLTRLYQLYLNKMMEPYMMYFANNSWLVYYD